MFVHLFLLFSIFQYINLSLKDFNCRYSDINRTIQIGDEVTLCLHSKELKRKVAFKLKVDEYTIVTINDGFEKLIPKETNNKANNEQENNNRRYRRRMVYDPNNDEEGQKNIENIGENETITSSPAPAPETTSAPTTEITDAPTSEPTEETIVDNPNDRAKIVAQIGDKITQYPGVINFYII
jgi:hypothetical protein